MYFPFAKDEAGQKAPYKIEKMKYYLIAGEPSGDLHGANLIRGLQKADPGAEFRFWGGDCMAAAGGAENLRKHYRETSFFGIVQVLKNLGTIRRQMRECQADVTEFAPDVLILVDYPGFNMKMARWAKEHAGISSIVGAPPSGFHEYFFINSTSISALKPGPVAIGYWIGTTLEP